MNVFIPVTDEYIGGVFETLKEAYESENKGFVNRFSDKPEDQVSHVNYEEYLVGSKDRIRSYNKNAELWWENGKDLRL